MKFAEWKSLRLIWFPWFLFIMCPYVYYSFFVESPDALQFVSSSITTSVMIGCIFYSIGLKFFTRVFWQSLFVIAVFDEIFGVYKNGIDIESLPVFLTIFLVLGLYAFQNKTIWMSNQADET